jgi:hypothetical protein
MKIRTIFLFSISFLLYKFPAEHLLDFQVKSNLGDGSDGGNKHSAHDLRMGASYLRGVGILSRSVNNKLVSTSSAWS